MPGHTTGAGFIAGIGKVSGVECVIGANDSTVKGGAVSEMTAWKSGRINDVAEQNRLPSISLIESAGADLPNQAKIFVPGGRGFRDLTRRSQQRIPSISLVFGSSTAGGAYLPGMSDYVVMVEKQAQVFLGRPPAREDGHRRGCRATRSSAAPKCTRASRASPITWRGRARRLRIGREIVAQLKWKKSAPRRTGGRSASLQRRRAAGHRVARHPVPFDAREVIARIVDGSRFSEFKPLYGTDAGVRFGARARVSGRHPREQRRAVRSGAEGPQFIELCNQTDVPLLFLQNITGFMVGKKYEQQGIIKHGAKLINAVSNSTVPAITIMTGGSTAPATTRCAAAPTSRVSFHLAESSDRGDGRSSSRRDRHHQARSRGEAGETVDEQKLGAMKAMTERDRAEAILLRDRAAVGRRHHRPARHPHRRRDLAVGRVQRAGARHDELGSVSALIARSQRVNRATRDRHRTGVGTPRRRELR